MTLYVYIRTSNGEETAALDLVKIFKDEASAKAYFKEDRDEVLSTLSGYEINYDWESNDQWEIIIDDDDSTTGDTVFRGFLETHELN